MPDTNGMTNLSLGFVHNYGYDAASRLQSVSTVDAGLTSQATYTYLANSPLVNQIAFANNGATRMTTSKSYDNLNRLTQISSAPSASSAVGFKYSYNSANQRTAVTNADNSHWSYGYDKLGQVTNGWRYWDNGDRVLGQTFNYLFDDIGNRKSIETGGDDGGAALRAAAYSVNLLNQYTNRTVPGYLEVSGTATNTATVLVNGVTTSRQGDYFRREVSGDNSSAALVQWLTSVATNANGTTTVARLTYVPQTPEAFAYDLDGNLTQDGLWNYNWDAENRLTRVETRTNAITDSAYWQRVDCDYDYQSRRVRKRVFSWDPSTNNYHLSTSTRFFYDGWNLIGQVDEVTGIRMSFLWGTDLSGAMQGAGGVGGLKAVIVHNGSLAGTYFYGYDGNGNVAVLVNATDGTEVVRYEYGPFGELLRVTGPLARLNPFRFSTKYHDDETDILYYGYRSYRPSTGRWLSRDPIGEKGGLNLYGFVRNDGVDRLDKFGLAGWVWDAANTSDYSISYDSGMTIRRHGAPTSTWYGTTVAELEAYRRGGLNNTLFQHYLHGHGAPTDLTSEATLKGEVISALTPNMDSAENDIRKEVESFTCSGNLSLFGISVSALGDTTFSSIDRTGFRSTIFVINTADAGLSKQCNAIVACLCNGKRYAIITCDFHMYFYDQFADAANLTHRPGVVTEWVGGTQFDETGAWGRRVYQTGIYR